MNMAFMEIVRALNVTLSEVGYLFPILGNDTSVFLHCQTVPAKEFDRTMESVSRPKFSHPCSYDWARRSDLTSERSLKDPMSRSKRAWCERYHF